MNTQPPVPGRTTITARALNRLAVGIVRDASRADATDVSLQLSDDSGALRARVTMPIVIEADDRLTVEQRAEHVRDEFVDRMNALAGRTVRRVDIRYSGVRQTQQSRVT